MIANLVLGGAHDGIRLDTFAPDDLPLTDTLVRANVVRGAAIDGISLGTETDNAIPGARIEANQAPERRRRHRRAPPRHAAARQHRNRNGDLGIGAVAGVIDGGANRAAGNGNLAQCAGVICR